MEDKIIISKVVGNYHLGDQGNSILDPVLMTHDQLLKQHQKVVTVGGLVFGISLDVQEKLFDGAILWRDEEVIVAINLVDEDVLEIRPFGNEEWARIAFNIGNMHHSTYLYPTYIRIPYDAIMERMLQHLNAPFERKMAKLDGERANAPAGHSHAHNYEHSHECNDKHIHVQNEDRNHEG